MLRISTTVAATAATLALLSPAVSAAPFGTGSAGSSEPSEPAAQVVTFGDYCEYGDGPAATADGKTAYCVRVRYTDAFVWSSTEDLLPMDPNVPVHAGEPCLDEGTQWVDAETRLIVCVSPGDDRESGDLEWTLAG